MNQFTSTTNYFNRESLNIVNFVGINLKVNRKYLKLS